MSNSLICDLNAAEAPRRLSALRELIALHRGGALETPDPTEFVNNHIHTTYSFSPYSPTMAAYKAWQSGLQTAGIMDHDSVAGGQEFIRAGHVIGIATTVGLECRCSMANTPFEGRRLNNPDQVSVAYLALHGIPHQNLGRVQKWITPYRQRRNLRNRAMVDRLNSLLGPWGVEMDFDADVASISLAQEGGSITERHILFALGRKLGEQVGRGRPLLDFLEARLSMTVGEDNWDKLMDTENVMYDYHLLGVLKSSLVSAFYIDAMEELPHIAEFIALAEEVGGISAYAYLGDVHGSVTGDKKDQAFEDAFLDELTAWLADSGFRALTYMPTRNTMLQLRRLIALCDRYGLFQISGEDINSPFQSFICPALKDPSFRHLLTNTWALIGHENAATEDIRRGMFSAQTIADFPQLRERADLFASLGRKYKE